jgi:hypothetical protein
MGDAVEMELGTSPLISDAWDWESDTDGDGYTLEQEIAFGTDPTDALDSGQNQTAITSKIILGDSNLLRSYWDYTLKLAGPERTFSIESSAGNTTTETILLRKGQTYNVSLSRTPEVDPGDQYPYGQGVPFVSSITSTNTALFIEEESEHSILTDHSGDAGTMDTLFDTYWNGTSLVSRETLHAKVHILNIAMERAGNALSNNGYTFISATAQMPDVTAKHTSKRSVWLAGFVAAVVTMRGSNTPQLAAYNVDGASSSIAHVERFVDNEAGKIAVCWRNHVYIDTLAACSGEVHFAAKEKTNRMNLLFAALFSLTEVRISKKRTLRVICLRECFPADFAA